MNLSEMVEEARELLDDRDQDGYEQGDLLVSDKRLIRLFNEAQDTFCFKSGYIRDMVPLAVKQGVQIYDVPDYVIRIIRVFSDQFRLGSWNDNSQYTFRPGEHEIVSDQLFSNITEPFAYMTDRDGSHQVRLLNIPSKDATFHMRVWRRPTERLEVEGCQIPEIPIQYHPALIEYAAGRVYTGHDVDIGENHSYKIHMKNFNSWVEDAKKELRAFEHRTVDFAIGQNGWTYSDHWGR